MYAQLNIINCIYNILNKENVSIRPLCKKKFFSVYINKIQDTEYVKRIHDITC